MAADDIPITQIQTTKEAVDTHGVFAAAVEGLQARAQAAIELVGHMAQKGVDMLSAVIDKVVGGVTGVHTNEAAHKESHTLLGEDKTDHHSESPAVAPPQKVVAKAREMTVGLPNHDFHDVPLGELGEFKSPEMNPESKAYMAARAAEQQKLQVQEMSRSLT